MYSFNQIKRIIKRKTVGIAGAGGLGSNVAIALARIGIGKLILADFDKVTQKNLNRQYYFLDQVGQKKVFALADNIQYINPLVRVECHDIRLTPGNVVTLFKPCDVIVEAFDMAETKEMFIEAIQTELPRIPLVAGLGMAGVGDNNSLRTIRIGNLFICGDRKNEISLYNPPLAPRVGIVANMQANLVLELLLNLVNNEDYSE